MLFKTIGALCIFLGCGGVGFQIAANYMKEERALRQLVSIIDFMASELQYRMTALPDLCKMTSQEAKGCLSTVFSYLSDELTAQIAPDVAHCMAAALGKVRDIPPVTGEMLTVLGHSLGRFDIAGQLRGLDSVRGLCRQKLEQLTSNKEIRVRSYKTLGLCAGAALAILFL